MVRLLLNLSLIERFIRLLNMVGLLKRPFMGSLHHDDLFCKICFLVFERRHYV